MPQYALAQLDQLVDVGGGDATIADRDRRLHHRQRHALGTVAEQLQVALLGGQHAVMRVLVTKVDIAPQDGGEHLACLAVITFAVPQRVVAVETDQLQHGLSRVLKLWRPRKTSP